MDARTRHRVRKAARHMLLYLVVVTITMVILTPVYFITVLSLL
ncbi:MAG: hypothetical protein Q9O62_00965 [Ardenticatenia bacterium]|nr:hypothetical protein [Ardenticatenia bacterium]